MITLTLVFDLDFKSSRYNREFDLTLHPLMADGTRFIDESMIDGDELARAMRGEGSHYVFTCTCGIPGCAGWEHTIVKEGGDWIELYNEQTPPARARRSHVVEVVAQYERLVAALRVCNIGALNRDRITPIVWAIDDIGLLKDLIRNGHDLNTQGHKGRTALMHMTPLDVCIDESCTLATKVLLGSILDGPRLFNH